MIRIFVARDRPGDVCPGAALEAHIGIKAGPRVAVRTGHLLVEGRAPVAVPWEVTLLLLPGAGGSSNAATRLSFVPDPARLSASDAVRAAGFGRRQEFAGAPGTLLPGPKRRGRAPGQPRKPEWLYVREACPPRAHLRHAEHRGRSPPR